MNLDLFERKNDFLKLCPPSQIVIYSVCMGCISIADLAIQINESLFVKYWLPWVMSNIEL